MVGWRHQLDGHEFEEAPEVGDGQRSLVQPMGSQSWTRLSGFTFIIGPQKKIASCLVRAIKTSPEK